MKLVTVERESAPLRGYLVETRGETEFTAAVVSPPELRTLDAIHLAAAMTAPDLRAGRL